MVKKRSRQAHTGTVYQSQGYWWAAVMIHGKRRRVRCDSKAGANAERDKLVDLAKASAGLRPSSFGEFRKLWLEHVKSNKSTSTHGVYELAVGKFKALDDIPLERITGQQIQPIIDGLSGRTKQQAFDKCKQMLNVAIRWGCLRQNPMANLERPSHERTQIDPFEVSEVQKIIEYFKDSRYAAAIRLAFACGLRGGELWGLQWDDFRGHELVIARQIAETSGRIEVKSPKTQAGIRKIMLPDSVCLTLDAKRKKAANGVPWIFPTENGEPTRRSNFAHREWNKALEKLELRHRGFHHTRHTAATILLNSGAVPIAVVSKMLGHASPKITLETYAHVMTADFEKHRNAFDVVTASK